LGILAALFLLGFSIMPFMTAQFYAFGGSFSGLLHQD
jgi:hypothetical protein